MDTFDIVKLQSEVAEDEGKELHLYKDSEGFTTVGVGRNIQANGISEDECALMFRNDCARSIRDLDAHAAWWRATPPHVQRVLINLCFNMGWPRLSGFVNTLAYMKAGNFPQAAANLKQSKWWTQVGERGPRMVARLLGTET